MEWNVIAQLVFINECCVEAHIGKNSVDLEMAVFETSNVEA